MREENTAMAVMTIAICDEIRKDAQKLYRQLSTLVPDAELLLYRTRESLLKGLAEGHKICDLIFLGLDGDQGRSLETNCTDNAPERTLYPGCAGGRE